MEHRDGLGTGLYAFILSQHTSEARNILLAHADQHQVFASGERTHTLADTDTLTVPNGVTLSGTLGVARSDHLHLKFISTTHLGNDYLTT